MRGLRELDCVELKDGRMGTLIEVFGDEAFLFEWATPDGEREYDYEFINRAQIARLLEND